jgi:hypothetical protein
VVLSHSSLESGTANCSSSKGANRTQPRASSLLNAMAVENGEHDAAPIDRLELRRGLVTSSTKRRISELSGLQHQFQDEGKLVRCSPQGSR